MLGIIGTNGAGKSTLLKGISGIYKPAEGSIKVEGKIAALLELYSGFDGDMTVMENTYLRGALLGYSKDFIDEKYNEIIEFAELQDFQHFQFKQLSSGMKSRLAFSIACLVNPDILILDEVLSTGDGGFQKKSGDKMKEIIKSGITCLFVSHSLPQVRELCNKILWLDHGNQIAFSNDVDLFCDAYSEFLVTHSLPSGPEDVNRMAEAYQVRVSKEAEEKKKREVKRIQSIMESGTREEAVTAALNVLRKQCPEALSESYLTKNGN
jgi:ABC-2 type transport system ATP-binding protein